MPYSLNAYKGDYIGRYPGQGDFLGIGKALKKIGGGILHAAGSVVGSVFRASPAGQIVHAVQGALTKGKRPPAYQQFTGPMPVLSLPGPGGPVSSSTTIGPKGSIYKHTEYGFSASGGGGRRINPKTGKPYRRMKVTNDKALRRSIRRLRGFEKLAKKALRPLGLSVHRTGSHGKARPFARKR